MISLDKLARRILTLRQHTNENIIEIGRLLVVTKRRAGHGRWGEWLRDKFAWSEDTAERYINVSKKFRKTNSATLRNLDLSAVYELARPSTPQSAREQVIQLIEKEKNPPSLADVRKIIRESKPQSKPQPQTQPKPVKPREAAPHDQFRQAIAILQSLNTKPAKTFAGIVPGDDLVMLANFLKQIASANVKSAPQAEAAANPAPVAATNPVPAFENASSLAAPVDLSIPGFLCREAADVEQAAT
jgi:hypothetical protein